MPVRITKTNNQNAEEVYDCQELFFELLSYFKLDLEKDQYLVDRYHSFLEKYKERILQEEELTVEEYYELYCAFCLFSEEQIKDLVRTENCITVTFDLYWYNTTQDQQRHWEDFKFELIE